jgi:hypothetical protein
MRGLSLGQHRLKLAGRESPAAAWRPIEGRLEIAPRVGIKPPRRCFAALHWTDPMTDTPPDRLAANPNSPYYDEALLERGVGVRFKGVDKTNVDEYCVSESWVRLTVGSTRDRAGNLMTVKLQGKVEPYFRDT